MPGPYVPLDVNYDSDLAIDEAGEAAEVLFIRALCYCKRGFTDGFIIRSQLKKFGLPRAEARARALVEAGLWLEVENGWQVRSWSRWNETPEEVARKRERDAERQRKRRDKAPVTDASQRDSDVTDAESHPLSKRQDKTETETVPPSAALALAVTPQTVISEWISRCRARPPDRVVGQSATHVANLLNEGFAPAVVAEGLDVVTAKGLNPATLPSVVNGLVNGSSKKSTTDERVGQALALAERYRNEDAS